MAKLREAKVSIALENAPLEKALGDFATVTSVSVRVDPELASSPVHVTLRMRDVGALNALNLILAADESWRLSADAQGLVVKAARDLPIDASELVRQGPTLALPPDLGVQKVSAQFNATPLVEVINFFQDVTGLDFVVAKEVDSEETKVSGALKDEPFTTALEQLLGPAGLVCRWRNGVVRVEHAEDPRAREALSLAATHLSLDLRGVTVPELHAALARAGVPAVFSRPAWRSRGTFSLVAKDATVSELVAAIGSRTSLHAWIGRDPVKGEALVVDGEVASVRDALEASAEPFTGVLAELADLRQRLLPEVIERSAARRDPKGDLDRLYSSERAVDLSTSAILALAERSHALAHTSTRRLDAQRKLEKARKGLDATNDALEKRKAEARELAALAKASSREPDARRAAEEAETARVALARAENEVRVATARVEELERELGAIEADQSVLERLRRGARLAEAERGR